MDSVRAMTDQLAEIFPEIERNFLLGVCEAYEGENPDFAEMVENVLSFEHPPLKEQVENNEENIPNFAQNPNKTMNSTIISSADPSDSSDSGIEIVKAVEVAENVNKLQETLVQASYERRLSQASQFNTGSTEFDGNAPLVYPGDLIEAESKTIKEECSSSSESPSDTDYEEGDSWEEFEDNFKDEKSVLESYTQTLQLATTGVNQIKIETTDFINDSALLDTSKNTLKDEQFKLMDEKTLILNLYESAEATNCLGSLPNVEDSFQAEDICHANLCQPSTSVSGFQVQVKPALVERQRNINKSCTGVCFKRKRPSYRSSKLAAPKPKLVRNSVTVNAIPLKQETDYDKDETESKTDPVFKLNDADSKFSLLSKVLPDADINFLLAQSKILTDHEAVLSFIAESLETRDYPKETKDNPKVTNYMEKFECNIEDFLREIPDPVAEFSSEFYSRTGYKENAELYLKARYRDRSLEEIREQLQTHGYNLTIVSEIFDSEGSDVNPFCLENLVLHHDADIFFHQEVWYIEHKNEIHDYMNSVIEAIKIQEELNKPPTPVLVEEVFECGICSEEIVEYLELSTCDGPQGHLFCKNCVRRSTEVNMAEGVTKFPCLHGCGGSIPLQTIEEVLPPHTFSKLCDKIQEEEVRLANVAALENCPFCPYAYGPGDEDFFTCKKPGCMKISCRTCLKEAHGNTLCDMFKNEDEETARHIIENKMSDALIRYCYSCKKPIVKSSGCNKMACVCGAKMCYICRQPVIDYTHFNGEGGDATYKCELFSTDETVHEQPVAASAQAALNEIQANNPGLQLDPNTLIPK